MAAAYAVSIFVGSLVLWLGIPLAWIWIVSQLSAKYPTIYFGAMIGCPVTMVSWGLLLARLNGAYLRETDTHPERQRTAWLKSLSGERGQRRPRSLLDWSMTISVLLAILAMAIWFFFYATNYGVSA
jgi:hypothetical protein